LAKKDGTCKKIQNQGDKASPTEGEKPDKGSASSGSARDRGNEEEGREDGER